MLSTMMDRKKDDEQLLLSRGSFLLEAAGIGATIEKPLERVDSTPSQGIGLMPENPYIRLKLPLHLSVFRRPVFAVFAYFFSRYLLCLGAMAPPGSTPVQPRRRCQGRGRGRGRGRMADAADHNCSRVLKFDDGHRY